MKKYIHYIQIYFKKISSFFFVKNKESEKILGSIKFEIDEESIINVSCLFPEFSDFTNIESLSQTFAKFLYMTVNLKMREEILAIIKSNSSSSPEDTLFYENLMFNLVLIEQEKRNNIINNQNQPIIKPSQVFSIARQK